MKNEKITVMVKFFATLRKYGPSKSEESYPKGSMVKDILDRYEVPEEDRNIVVLINTKPHQKKKTILHDGDVVSIFPPIAGG
jgi:molybdopterin converting factor small subunit